MNTEHEAELDDPAAEVEHGTQVEPTASVEHAAAAEEIEESAPAALDPAELVSALEAVLFVVDEPVTVATLASALQQPTVQVEQALERLR
ncbi:MAG TPA: hypothetical protein VFT67_01030, partial [Jatrophihabitantaceae bacterium]|nr:hypothetical protein [Jatrophihabitantaceae bacterium]